MNNNRIALQSLTPIALMLVCLSAAHAQMSIYGLIDMSYGKNIAEDAAKDSADFHSGGDGGSSSGNSTTKLGFKGSQDLGSGIKANFKLETNGITSDGEVPAPFFNRQVWAGFSGGFGEVRLGKQDSVPFQTMIGFDFNGAANAASAQGNSGAATWGRGRQSGSLQYISPNINGFKAQVGYVPKGNEDTELFTNNVVSGASVNTATSSIGLTYANGPFAVAYAGETKRYEAGKSFTSVAGSYDLGMAKVMLGYANGGTNAKGTSVGLVTPVSGFNVGINYSRNHDTDVSASEFFINREIYKNTVVYFDYGHVDKTAEDSAHNTISTKGNASAVGLIYTF